MLYLILSSAIVSTTYEFEFVGAQPGRWRVWTLDKEGREGFKARGEALFIFNEQPTTIRND